MIFGLAGIVCTAGADEEADFASIRGWDPRQGRLGSSLNPIFDVPCRAPDGYEDLVHAMIPIGYPEQNGARHLLTGVLRQMCTHSHS
jgi:hypothetical protein